MIFGKCFFLLQHILKIFENFIINNADWKDTEFGTFGEKLAPNCDIEDISSGDRRDGLITFNLRLIESVHFMFV